MGTSGKNNLAIMTALARGCNTPKTISVAIQRNRGSVHRALAKLISAGMVHQEQGSKQYFLTASGRSTAIKEGGQPNHRGGATGGNRADPSDNKELLRKRGENLRVKFLILAAPKGWRESPKSFFEKEHLNAVPLGLKNVDGVDFTIDMLRYRVTSSSILLMFKEGRYTQDAVALMQWLMPVCFDAMEMLEKRFPGLRLDPAPIVVCGEMAHEQDPVAQFRAKEGFHVIYHTDGRVRVQFDASKGPREAEFMHPGMFDADSETWDRRMIQVLNSRYDYDVLGVMAEDSSLRLDDHDRRLEKLLRASELIVQNQAVFDRNMASHLAVLNKLGRAVERLGVAVKGNNYKEKSSGQSSLSRYTK